MTFINAETVKWEEEVSRRWQDPSPFKSFNFRCNSRLTCPGFPPLAVLMFNIRVWIVSFRQWQLYIAWDFNEMHHETRLWQNKIIIALNMIINRHHSHQTPTIRLILNLKWAENGSFQIVLFSTASSWVILSLYSTTSKVWPLVYYETVQPLLVYDESYFLAGGDLATGKLNPGNFSNEISTSPTNGCRNGDEETFGQLGHLTDGREIDDRGEWR